ncbi:MAG: cellulase family glycosylhydrolase [Acidobacteriota bacterium]
MSPRSRISVAKMLGLFWLTVILFTGCQKKSGDQPKSYVLTVRVTGHGKVSPSGGTYEPGTVVTLTATPDEGNRLSSWRGTDNDASTATINTVTMTGPKTVEVTFVSTVFEDFEGSSAATDWIFSNGPEFPGARGGFAVIAGRGRAGSKGGVLNFDFTGGGNYVITSRTLGSPLQAAGISFWVSGFVPGTRLLVRLTDETDQTFQYFPNVGDKADSGWRRASVLLEDWDSYWGGPADGMFHGGLKSCGIGVEKGVQYYKTGEMVIDDISELASTEVAFDPFGQDLLPEFFTGPVSSLLGVNIHFIRPDLELLDLAKQAGFGFVRMDLFWDLIETSAGHYDFSDYDLLANALEDRGLGALFILDYANLLYYDGPGDFNPKWGPQTPAARSAYANFALAAARHYSGQPVMLEIWNEPNISQFWAPSPDPVAYSLLVDATYQAVKSEITNVRVVVGATSGCDAIFLGQVFALPSLSVADSVSIHPYRSTAPETFVQERLLVEEVLKQKTGRDDIPLYSGEWGYPSTLFGGRTAAAWHAQAVYAIRTILINIRSHVPKTVWYDLQDDGPNPSNAEHNFGLLTNGVPMPKPAYNAVKTLSDLLPGRESNSSVNSWTISTVETRSNDVYGLVFGNDRGRLAALWTARKRGKADITIPDSAALQFYDMFGEPLTSVRREGGFCFISLESEKGPVYVKI